jgi:chromosome segregation ATPase
MSSKDLSSIHRVSDELTFSERMRWTLAGEAWLKEVAAIIVENEFIAQLVKDLLRENN